MINVSHRRNICLQDGNLKRYLHGVLWVRCGEDGVKHDWFKQFLLLKNEDVLRHRVAGSFAKTGIVMIWWTCINVTDVSGLWFLKRPLIFSHERQWNRKQISNEMVDLVELNWMDEFGVDNETRGNMIEQKKGPYWYSSWWIIKWIFLQFLSMGSIYCIGHAVI